MTPPVGSTPIESATPPSAPASGATSAAHCGDDAKTLCATHSVTDSEPHSTPPSARTRLRRLPDRGHYDAATIAAIVDAAPFCTVAFHWDGAVHALPTAHWREGEHLYIHGAKASRMLKALSAGEACVTVALIDGLVFARSAFHHSMNYRSVAIYGRFEAVEAAAAKERSLRAFIERLAPGRWDTLRPITAKELNATTVLRLPLAEASAKLRSGGAKDDAEDMSWPVWAGVVPLYALRGAPQTEPDSVLRTPPPALAAATGTLVSTPPAAIPSPG